MFFQPSVEVDEFLRLKKDVNLLKVKCDSITKQNSSLVLKISSDSLETKNITNKNIKRIKNKN